jgi:hypothetical protein
MRPHCERTGVATKEYKVILSLGDTTFLDYKKIKEKREGYGPTGKGGNGLIVHSAMAVDAETGQTIGLLWQKVWSREEKEKAPAGETVEEKKEREAEKRKKARERKFEEKESYKWVEGMREVEKKVEKTERVIHIFDREGDVTEVLEKCSEMENTGGVIRATHNRKLEKNEKRLWQKMESEAIKFEQEIVLSGTGSKKERKAKLAVRYSAVRLQKPYRFEVRESLKVYAVYATEIECPEGEKPISWMLLTTEVVENVEEASTILRWYNYRWRIEEYHKILKSGCQTERYRLAALGMKTLLGFLSVIAVELLKITYLHRNQPLTPASEILTPLQIEVLIAGARNKPPRILTVAWAVECIAYLGGYLEHRQKTLIGIQVLWRGLLKLHDLCQGWLLAKSTYREK